MVNSPGIRADPDRQIPAWAQTVGPGWAALLDRLHRDLLILACDYQLDDLGSRFGGLRVRIADRFDPEGEFDGAFADAAGALIDAAEVASQQICETCGASGRARFRGDSLRSWIQTSCDGCRSPSAAARRQPPDRT